MNQAIETAAPADLEGGIKFIIEHGDTLTQRQLKSFPNRWVRKANRVYKRNRDAAFADEAVRRVERKAQAFMERIEPEVRKAEAEGKLTKKADFVLRRLAKIESDRSNAEPLWVRRSDKHDPATGSRAIRRQVSRDWRKGTKPAPGGHGSVRLNAADLIELHGRLAANVLGIESYNKALAEAQAIGRLKHLVPIVPKREADAPEERKAA